MRASDISSRGLAGTDFLVSYEGSSERVHSPLPGARLVYNALAAIAVAVADGVAFKDAAAALAEVAVPTRLQRRETAAGVVILDDSYNASPASMLAALDVLAETPAGRRLALLGDMLELGEAEAEGHHQVGERAAEVVDTLVTTGARGRMIAEAARAAGTTHVQHHESRAEAATALASLLVPGDVVLVKASHGLRLDAVVAELLAG
jgi:UDP-N-acetylmuramoyl-tripeptide--D-alanyl-D-alanine ligase